MAEAMGAAAEQAGALPSDLDGVGVGSPGAVDSGAGTVSQARNLAGWKGTYPLGARLAKSLGTRVLVDNDVRVAVRAEFLLGAGKGFDSILGAFWGTGVGGGIILNGEPWFGRGAAGEIGHMVIKDGGARCGCGRRGCVEAYAGRGAMEAKARRLVKRGHKTKLFELMKRANRPRLTSGVWAKALDGGDAMAEELMLRAVEALAAGIASAVNLLDVEAVVIGGGLGTRLGKPYTKKIEQAMMPHLFVSDRPPEVRVAALGDLGGASGASLLVD
jgi:glucokinase